MTINESLRVYKKLRKTWAINPKTRVKDKKNKARHNEKVEWEKEIADELLPYRERKNE